MAALGVDDASWLVSPAGREAVDEASALVAADPDPLRAATALRRGGLGPSTSALALTQALLRERAVDRLGAGAVDLLLTDDGLAQATRPVVAARRAARLAACGVGHVLDAGCGLGLDARAFAAAGLRVTAVERDPALAVLARANLAEADATVLQGDVTEPALLDAALAGVEAVFADPARRDPAGPRRADGSAHRITDPGHWSPPWPWVAGLSARVPRVSAKLAPGVARDLAPDWELAWTSHDGDLVEAAVWSPAMARPRVRRAAVVIRGALVHEVTDADDPWGEDADGGRAPVGPVRSYLLEPDDAVIRAGLVGAVVARVDGRLLDPHLAYVTADDPSGADGLARAFRVLDVGTVDESRLRTALARLGAGDVVVKQRGLQTDPAALRRRIKPGGAGRPLVVLLARVTGGAVAVVAEAVTSR